jgi:hypothetical protein
MPRSSIYALLTVVAVGLVCGRLASTTIQTIGANDRSRWCTVRALVHDGTYAIGHRKILPDRTYRDEGIVVEGGWGTIDKVLDPETRTFYSSKPPLFQTVVAGVYGLVRAITGWSITTNQLAVIWSVLAVVNLIPFVLYCVLLGRVTERFGLTDWGRLYVFAAGCFGTFVTTFQGVLNNHTPAACAALGALYYATAPRANGGLWQPALAGLCAGLAAVCDLPAASLLVCVIVWVGLKRGPGSGLAAAGGAALPVIALLLTNYLAIGQLHPAYAHVGSAWYLYEGSPWKGDQLAGIERAGSVEGKLDYALNLTLGHHGLFSLTPVFVLAVWGLFPRRAKPTPGAGRDTGADEWAERSRAQIIWVAALLTVIVVAFYTTRTSNYGGIEIGPRWFFWLTPLLLLASLRAADELGESRTGRRLGYCLLAVSVLSASYYATAPWSHHPWLYDLMCYVDPALQY